MIIDEEVEDFLEHYGVKGQRWGVRRARRTATLQKVGRGEGTRTEKLQALSQLSTVDLVRGKGLKGAAAAKGQKLADRQERMKKGEATVKDKIAHYGSTNVADLIPTSKSVDHKKSRKAKVGLAVVGGLLVANGLFTLAATKM